MFRYVDGDAEITGRGDDLPRRARKILPHAEAMQQIPHRVRDRQVACTQQPHAVGT